VVTFLLIPFAFGIYYIKEGIKAAVNKISGRKKEEIYTNKEVAASGSGSFKLTFIAVFFAAILFFPVNAFASNYAAVDKSRDTKIYDYWKAVERELEDNSIIFSSSKSTSVLAYLLLYESDKNVKIERGLSYEEMLSSIKENIGKNTLYFNQAYMPDLSNAFELEPVSYFIYWMDYREELKTYKVLGVKKYVGFELAEKELSFKFGEEKNISYTITNKSETEPVYMDSIELGLPKSLSLVGIDESASDIKVMPGMASGFYMWTNGPYIIEPSQEMTISVKVKAVAPDENSIRFRITTNNLYEEAPEVIISIQ